MLAGSIWRGLKLSSSLSIRMEGGKGQSIQEDGRFDTALLFTILVPNLIF